MRYLGFKWISLQTKIVIFLDLPSLNGYWLLINIRKFHTESEYRNKTAYWSLWLRSLFVCWLVLTIISKMQMGCPFFIEQNWKDRNSVFADFVWYCLKKISSQINALLWLLVEIATKFWIITIMITFSCKI